MRFRDTRVYSRSCRHWPLTVGTNSKHLHLIKFNSDPVFCSCSLLGFNAKII